MTGKRVGALLVAVALGVLGGRLARQGLASRPSVSEPAAPPAAGYSSAAPRGPAPALPDPAPDMESPAPRHILTSRAPDEWQGMPVDLAERPHCETAATCGLAMACVDGRCGPCSSDAQCLSGERCALDHCVRDDKLACRTRSDCNGDELCALSGYSPDPRGNASMAATCLSSSGAAATAEIPRDESPPPKEPGDAVTPAALLDTLTPPAP